jgi:hypothetical protein
MFTHIYKQILLVIQIENKSSADEKKKGRAKNKNLFKIKHLHQFHSKTNTITESLKVAHGTTRFLGPRSQS